MVGKEKKCIGIIFGGNSNEHYVSISSAKTVFKALISKRNKERFRVKAFYINRHGVWLDNKQSLEVLSENFENYSSDKYQIMSKGGINFLHNIEFQSIDIWFPLLHGVNVKMSNSWIIKIYSKTNGRWWNFRLCIRNG